MEFGAVEGFVIAGESGVFLTSVSKFRCAKLDKGGGNVLPGCEWESSKELSLGQDV